MRFRVGLATALVACFVVPAARAGEVVPPPAETPAEVVVSGRSSTPRNITIRKVGQAIPPTFSGDRIKNTPGFTWYVSRHYALKTDLTEEQARHYLTLLELAFPHYVKLFGRTLPDLDRKRMAVIYAKDKTTLAQALKSDGIAWNFNGGGITYEGYNAAYQYPSGSLQYHLRYILLHECAHLYQICLTGTVSSTPNWYVEGVADTLANHVWEEGPRRLTVNVADKPTVNNYWDAGLRRFQKEPFTVSAATPRDAKAKAVGGRDVGFLLVTYFTTDVERLMKFRVWRDELFRLDLRGQFHERAHRLLEDLFGGWAKLDADFTNWARRQRPSFHYVEWGWEQDGETLMSYGFPNSGTHSQTDLLHPPGEAPAAGPLVMDYPRRTSSPLVAPVKRGTGEPVVGGVIGFRKNPGRGEAGLGLGVEGRSCLRVLIDGGQRLILDGSDLGAETQATPLPPALRQAMAANDHEVGLTIKIGKESVFALVRAGRPGRVSEHRATLRVSHEQRERLLKQPMAVLSRGGLHFITPYFDVPVLPELNVWNLHVDRELYAAYRAAWRLGDQAPATLLTLRDNLLKSATGPHADQRKVLAEFAEALPEVRKEIQSCAAPAEAIRDVLAWLDELR